MEKEELSPSQSLPDSHCCKNCLKFDQFGEKCFVFWENKKLCTMKVKTPAEWSEERMLFGG